MKIAIIRKHNYDQLGFANIEEVKKVTDDEGVSLSNEKRFKPHIKNGYNLNIMDVED